MHPYYCRLRHGDGAIDEHWLGTYDSTEEAVRAGRGALLASLSAVAVEIWAQSGKVRELNRCEAEFRARN